MTSRELLRLHFTRDAEQPDKKLSCPICLLVLGDPVMDSSCGQMFCAECVKDVHRCPMCLEENPNFTRAPVYVHDNLCELPKVTCTVCAQVMVAVTAYDHYHKECPRLVKPLADAVQPTNPLEDEVCIASISAPFQSHMWVSTHGRFYQSDSKTADAPAQLCGRPLAPGLQWILQQLSTKCQWPAGDRDVRAMVGVLSAAEHHRPHDFGLQNELTLKAEIADLRSQFNDLLAEMKELRYEADETEERCLSLMYDLKEARDQVAQMQEFHVNDSDSSSSTRRRRRRSNTHSDGQPSFSNRVS